MKTLEDVLDELRRRTPATLSLTTEQMIEREGGIKVPERIGFSDEHEFTVTLPAWLWRVLNGQSPRNG